MTLCHSVCAYISSALIIKDSESFGQLKDFFLQIGAWKVCFNNFIAQITILNNHFKTSSSYNEL